MFLAWHFIGYGKCSEAQGAGRFLSPAERQRELEIYPPLVRGGNSTCLTPLRVGPAACEWDLNYGVTLLLEEASCCKDVGMIVLVKHSPEKTLSYL